MCLLRAGCRGLVHARDKRDAGATRALVAGESPLGGCVAGAAKRDRSETRNEALGGEA